MRREVGEVVSWSCGTFAYVAFRGKPSFCARPFAPLAGCGDSSLPQNEIALSGFIVQIATRIIIEIMKHIYGFVLTVGLFAFSHTEVLSETLETCPQPTPDGWVIISHRACAGCCGQRGIVHMPTIKRIDNLKAGATLEICPQPTPKGWVVISHRASAGCCGQRGIVHRPTIKKIDGLPSGTSLEICPQPIPAGWVSTGTRASANCCGGRGIQHRPTIRKL